MQPLYLIALYLYYYLILIASIWNQKARNWISGRKNWEPILKSKLDRSANYFWFHAASLGEFEQGRPLIERIKKDQPEIKIILTFFSPSGYEVRKNYPLADIICYLPLDTPNNARNFIKLVQPKKVFFIKYEFWYFYLHQLHFQNIPTYLISGIFRDDQLFFKWFGFWYRNMLGFFTRLFVQNHNSYVLLKKLNINNIEITGDTRFDRVYEISQNSQENTIVNKFSQDVFTLMAGSSWPQEEQYLSRFLKEHPQENFRLVIAPHEVDEINISRIESLFSGKTVRYTQISNPNEIPESKKVLIIDTIGILSGIYKYGSVALIGGGFGKGIHNILEPATYGIPVIFGPRHQRFQEALDLLETGGAFTFKTYSEFTIILNKIINDHSYRERSGQKSLNYIKKSIGATNKIMEEI